MIDLLELDNISFLKRLHCEVLACLLVLSKAHSTKGTCVEVSKKDYSPVPRVVDIS